MIESSPTGGSPQAIRTIPLRLAKAHDDLAADEAAATPYWMPCPPTVFGHRAAADSLRAQADQCLVPSWGAAS